MRLISLLRVPLAATVLAVLLTCPRPAAAEPSADDRNAARALVIDGRAKLAAHDNEGARKAFAAAHAIMGVPTTGLDLAKAQKALGLLIEARATALDVVRMPVLASEPEAFTNARPLAAELAAKLEARIPSIVVTVKGLPAGVEVSVLVDGAVMPASALALPRKINPGTHVIQISVPGFDLERREVMLAEGESLPIELVLKPLVALTKEPAAKPAPSARSTLLPTKKKDAPLWPWVAAGAGAVALGVSSVFVVDYAQVRSTVSTDCPDSACDPRKYTAEDVDALKQRWNRDLGLFIGLGVAGAASIGIAIAGFTGKLPRGGGNVQTTAIAPWLSAGGGGAFMTRSF